MFFVRRPALAVLAMFLGDGEGKDKDLISQSVMLRILFFLFFFPLL